MGPGRQVSIRVDGKEQIKQLAQATVAALYEADLTEEVGLFESRVFSRAASELFETEVDQQGRRWRFKPMVELLLRHTQQVAALDARATEERRREIRWALDAAGF